MSAELIAALKDALPYVKAQARFTIDKRAQAIAQECNGALANAEAQSQRMRNLEHTLACARGWIAPELEFPGILSEGSREMATHLLSEIDALLKGSIYERPQAEVER